jgi:hypothetical protein
MDLPDWLAMMLAFGGGAAAVAPSLRALRSRRHLQVVNTTLACPRTGQTVHCEMELDRRTESYAGILRCSAKEPDRRPSCDQDCVRVLNMGIPLRPLGGDAGTRDRASESDDAEGEGEPG